MTCNKTEKLLSLYIDNQLSDTKTEYVKKHLASCDACQQLCTALYNTSVEINNLPDAPLPANFAEKLHLALAEVEIKQPKKKYMRSVYKYSTVMAGVAVVAILITGYYDNFIKSNIAYIDRVSIATYDDSEEVLNDKYSIVSEDNSDVESDISKETDVVRFAEPQTKIVERTAEEKPVERNDIVLFDGADAFVAPEVVYEPEEKAKELTPGTATAMPSPESRSVTGGGANSGASVPQMPMSINTDESDALYTEYSIITNDELLIVELNQRYYVLSNTFYISKTELSAVFKLLDEYNAEYELLAENESDMVRVVIAAP